MVVTFKAKLSHHTNKDGTHTVFIHILMNREKREVISVVADMVKERA